MCCFSIGNGSTSRTPLEVRRFSTKFYRFSLQNGTFPKIFVSVLVFFFAPIFIFEQICAAFRLEMGQRVRLYKRFIIFRQILSFQPPQWHFFESFPFGACIFFALEFIFVQICVAFRLELGQRAGIHRRFIVLPNSIVSASKMAFFL